MEEEGEAEVIAEEAEAVAEAMAVEAVVVMEEAADTAAARVAEEASNATGAQYLWRRARRSMSRSTRSVEEATGSPVSTTS